MKSKLFTIARWVLAIILLQTLFFKFTAHPDSVYIFTQAGMEPVGRIGIGIIELFAAILVLIPKTAWLGAGLALGVICGAIFLHLTQLGIAVNEDGGALFGMAVAVFVLALGTLWHHKSDLPIVGSRWQ